MKFREIFIILLAIFVLNLDAKEPNLRQKISQMIMVGFHGQSMRDVGVRIMLSDLSYSRFGGVMLLGRNVANKDQLKALTKEIKLKQDDVFIAIDEEGGQVTRLKDVSFGNGFLSAYDVGINLDINEASAMYETMAKNLNEYGINMNFAPVLDIHSDASPIIGAKKRAYSNDPRKITLYAEIFMDALEKFNVISVLKHFPGHGNSKEDSHLAKTYSKLTKEELLPYQKAIKSGKAKAIMVGHLYVTNLDDKKPATFSRMLITSLLREELGFNGVVISDDMLMRGAGDEPLKDKIVNFINAGGDILLFSEFKIGNERIADVVYEHIKNAINEGKISINSIDEAYKRIKILKENFRRK